MSNILYGEKPLPKIIGSVKYKFLKQSKATQTMDGKYRVILGVRENKGKIIHRPETDAHGLLFFRDFFRLIWYTNNSAF